MHSRIFQLTGHKLPENHYLEESDLSYEEGMPISIADYISNSDREEDIRWLLDCFKDNKVKGWTYNEADQSLTFTKPFMTSYFKSAYDLFKKKAEQITLEDFSHSFGDIPVYSLSSLIEERDGFYVFMGPSSTGYFRTMDSFVRSLNYELKEKDSVTFYIGGTLDYHC